MTATEWTAESAGSGQYADVNGINLYYETYGAGRPMILLHGGLGSGEMFGPILPTLADHHQVIVVDLQGHGRTADIDRPIDVRLMADDIAALIDHLGLDKPDVVGYSLGGGVAFQVAIKYPEKVGRLVSASANIRRDAIYPEMLQQQGQVSAAAAEFMKDTPMYELYQRVAPRPEDFPQLLDKIGEAMAKDFDFSRGGSRPAGADARGRRRCRHGAAEPLRRGLQAPRRWPARRRLDGRGPAQGWSRTGDPARSHALQPVPVPAVRSGHPRLPRPGELSRFAPPGGLRIGRRAACRPPLAHSKAGRATSARARNGLPAQTMPYEASEVQMHAGQLTVSLETVRRLVIAQFPEWQSLPIRRLASAGTVNAIFRLGDQFTARFPLEPADVEATRRWLESEAAAARLLRGRTRFPTPEPVALGEPGPGYPLPWSVQTWIPGIGGRRGGPRRTRWRSRTTWPSSSTMCARSTPKVAHSTGKAAEVSCSPMTSGWKPASGTVSGSWTFPGFAGSGRSCAICREATPRI